MNEQQKQWLKEYQREMPKLLAQWKADGNVYAEGENDRADVFISDGIAVPELWFNQEVRPLIVLKEAYDTSEAHEDWDELEWFITGGHKQGKISSKTWCMLSRWASYLFTEKYGLYDKDVSQGWDNPCLQHIALINVKKYGGHSQSSDADLRRHVAAHYENIYRQIELIKPTIIICGNTGWLLDLVWTKMFGKSIRGEHNSTWVYDVPHLAVPAKMLDYWHPSNLRCTVQDSYACIDRLFENAGKPVEANEGRDDD